MKKVAAIVRLMSMPISCAASRSWAVARIALPSFVRLMKSESITTRKMVTTTTNTSLMPMSTSEVV